MLAFFNLYWLYSSRFKSLSTYIIFSVSAGISMRRISDFSFSIWSPLWSWFCCGNPVWSRRSFSPRSETRLSPRQLWPLQASWTAESSPLLTKDLGFLIIEWMHEWRSIQYIFSLCLVILMHHTNEYVYFLTSGSQLVESQNPHIFLMKSIPTFILKK